MKKLAILVLACLSYGCATLSEEECRTVDWYDLGFADGQSGYKSRANSHSENCGKYGVRPDLNQYREGYQSGLDVYCTYENGVRIGQMAGVYQNVCVGGARQEFYEGYLPYYNVANTQKRVSAERRSIIDSEKKLKEKDLSSKDRSSTEYYLGQKKSNFRKLRMDLLRYEYELSVHVIDREIKEISDDLKNGNITGVERQDRLKRVRELQKLRRSETNNYKMKKTAMSIKEIKDMFD